jgi:hypothetical protein
MSEIEAKAQSAPPTPPAPPQRETGASGQVVGPTVAAGPPRMSFVRRHWVAVTAVPLLALSGIVAISAYVESRRPVEPPGCGNSGVVEMLVDMAKNRGVDLDRSKFGIKQQRDVPLARDVKNKAVQFDCVVTFGDRRIAFGLVDVLGSETSIQVTSGLP